ncbi:MAG: SDR family oxidoreductase [Pikeienuella sp.]|uniref:SDR family oxidoreductase n=1 Tax=Pikeienuella sp. TaxID=2831957 RepID=UPI0039191AFA
MSPGAALVTGGAKRLGRAMALALAADGWDVAFSWLGSQPEAEETAEAIRALGRRVAPLRADLTEEAETDALLPAAAAALGRPLTCLVNNASIFEFDDMASATRASWDRAIESNLRAPVRLTQLFAAQAPKAAPDAAGEPEARAVVVNMIDQRVLKPTPMFLSYSVAKHALWAFTRMAAQGLAPDIRVAAIGPGPTLQGARQSAGHFAAQRAATPLARGAGPDEIAAALRFILATPAFTGQMLALDGGQHLAWETPDVLGVE